MPVYQYKCPNKDCKTDTYDEVLSIKDCEKKTNCPDCGTEGIKQFPVVPKHGSWSKWNGIV
jgi:putative FmdB family regulatory protein